MVESARESDFPIKARPRIAIVYPMRDQVDGMFAVDLAIMAGYTSYAAASDSTAPSTVTVSTCAGTYIADQRNDLAQLAIEQDMSHILWLDSDMRFPKDTIFQLLARDKPIVGANYCTRVPPHKFVAHIAPEHPLKTFDDSIGIEPVAWLGFGCVLTQVDVFKNIDYPWFAIHYSEESNDFMGEDISFCRQAILSGYEIFVDHDLTKLVRHSGRMEYNYIHALDSMYMMEEVEKEMADGADNELRDFTNRDRKLVEPVGSDE